MALSYLNHPNSNFPRVISVINRNRRESSKNPEALVIAMVASFSFFFFSNPTSCLKGQSSPVSEIRIPPLLEERTAYSWNGHVGSFSLLPPFPKDPPNCVARYLRNSSRAFRPRSEETGSKTTLHDVRGRGLRRAPPSPHVHEPVLSLSHLSLPKRGVFYTHQLFTSIGGASKLSAHCRQPCFLSVVEDARSFFSFFSRL